MATNNTAPEEMNSFLQQISDNLSVFIENINCLRETYGYSEGTLNQQYSNAESSYNSFITQYKCVGADSIDLQIPREKLKEYKKLEKKKLRAQKAFELIPPTYIISIVSLFDSFYAGLIRCVFSLKPDRLQESNQTFRYSEIKEYGSIKEIKQAIIDNTIEGLLRDSHVSQINWLEKALGVDTLKKFEGWGDFIELTERRNLFVHSEGVVSSQYLTECRRHGFDVSETRQGSKLIVDKEYFESSYRLVYRMGIMLTQILINKLYLGVYSNDTEERDKIFINNVYELICDKQYEVAIQVSDFVLNKPFKHKGKDRSYIILNKAQSLKWLGRLEDCVRLLEKEDASTWNDDLLIPKLTLEDNYQEVYRRMKQLGDKSEVLNQSSYREWPIFNQIRKEKEFAETFKNIFGQDLNENQTIKVEDTKNEESLSSITEKPTL